MSRRPFLMGYTHYYEILDTKVDLKIAEIGTDIAAGHTAL